MKNNIYNEIAVILGGEGAVEINYKAYGHVAAQIKEKARKFAIPIVKNKLLAEILSEIPDDTEIPPDLVLALDIILETI